MKKSLILLCSSIMVLSSCGTTSQESTLTTTGSETTTTTTGTETTTSEQQDYTVTWVVDGLTTTETYSSGETPEYKGDTDKEADNTYVYEFSGWEPAIEPVNGDITYTAQYTQEYVEYMVTWVVGETQTQEAYHFRDMPVFKGSTDIASTAQYDYQFIGWDQDLEPVTRDITYTAQYNEQVKNYTISFVVNGETTTKEVAYGSMPDYGSTPTKESCAEFEYEFSGWEPALASVTGNQTYTAKFEETKRKYDVTWVVGENSYVNQVEYGTMPTEPVDVRKESTETTEYHFTGWDKNIAIVTGPVTYVAQFSESPRKYTVTFNLDGEEYATEQVEYGSSPSLADITNPTKSGVTFRGWKLNDVVYVDELPVVNGNVTYEAAFAITVTVQHQDLNGSLLADNTVIEVEEGEQYTVDALELEGLHANTPYLSGRVGDKNVNLDIYYSELDVWDGSMSSEFVGQGTEANPYLIEAGKDLALLKDKVDSGEKFTGKYFKMTKSLQLDATFGRIGQNFVYKDTVDSDGNVTTPHDHSFEGYFDGNNCAITNYSNMTSAVSAGLFIGIGSGAVIENLSLTAETSGSTYSTLLVSKMYNATIRNCVTYGKLTQNVASGNAVGAVVGGIAGNSVVENCENYAEVVSTAVNNKTAGVCGFMETDGANLVTDCVNHGNISGSTIVGGVVAEITKSGANKVVNCTNYGLVTSDPSGTGNGHPVGGVVGTNSGTVTYCVNEGTVNGQLRTGGVVGNNAGSVTYCVNKGAVNGGVGTNSTSTNKGQWVGGIVGVALNGSSVENSTNEGTVNTTAAYVGGIVGCVGNSTTTTITNCVNKADVTTAANDAGGICGGALGTASTMHLSSCTNEGVVSGNDKVGGIVGWVRTADSTITDCVNNGEIKWQSGTSHGDIRGA